ncbi:MAG: hypothetical protein AAGN82_05545 [Myxococcota bacterium]
MTTFSSRRAGAGLLGVALAVSAAPAAANEPVALEPPPRRHRGWGLHTSVAASLDNGALAGVVGGRYALTERFVVGLDAEYNPWLSLEAGRFSRGAFNGYGTFIYRYPVRDAVALRISLHVGFSVLLFDLVGAPAGSVGPLVGGNFLGMSYEVADQVYFVIDPAQLIVPAPQIRGAPFVYQQYRLSLGLQFGG